MSSSVLEIQVSTLDLDSLVSLESSTDLAIKALVKQFETFSKKKRKKNPQTVKSKKQHITAMKNKLKSIRTQITKLKKANVGVSNTYMDLEPLTSDLSEDDDDDDDDSHVKTDAKETVIEVQPSINLPSSSSIPIISTNTLRNATSTSTPVTTISSSTSNETQTTSIPLSTGATPITESIQSTAPAPMSVGSSLPISLLTEDKELSSVPSIPSDLTIPTSTTTNNVERILDISADDMHISDLSDDDTDTPLIKALTTRKEKGKEKRATLQWVDVESDNENIIEVSTGEKRSHANVTGKEKGKGRKKRRLNKDEEFVEPNFDEFHESDLAILHAWLTTKGKKPPIPAEVKKRVRDSFSYLPEAYCTTFALTVEMLTNDLGNVHCVHHFMKDKSTSHVDGDQTIAGVAIHGVPYPKAGVGKKETKIQVQGFLTCGCAPETAIAGALLWKKWSVSSIIDGTLIKEGFGPIPLTPRNILFFIQNMKKLGFNWRNLFTGLLERDSDEHEQFIAVRTVERIRKQYKETWGVDIPIKK